VRSHVPYIVPQTVGLVKHADSNSTDTSR
jgi:hypothetical protein